MKPRRAPASETSLTRSSLERRADSEPADPPAAERRRYQKRRRAENEAGTRDRIVEAVMALHEELGPARTTISAIAERAGVQRLTVYRHFPDESALIAACSARWSGLMPPPDLATIRSDGTARAGEIFRALYRYFRAGDRMLTRVLADAETMPVVNGAMEPMREYLRGVVGDLDRCWPQPSERRRMTIEHAVQFATWKSLDAMTGGDDEEAAAIVMAWCNAF